jgi:hypothetical protein
MDIQVKTDLKQLQKKLDILRDKTFNKVMSEGINFTAERVVNAQRQMLVKKLHRPKPFSVKSIIMSQFAKPSKTRLKATVRVKDKSASYLYYIYTGDIEPARREAYASPTNEGRTKANQYGNIVTKKGLLKKIDATDKSNRKGSRFVGVPKGKGSKVYGVWERQGKKGREGLNLLVAYTPFIRHRKFIDWFKLSHKVVKNNLYKEINKQMIKRVKRVMR